MVKMTDVFADTGYLRATKRRELDAATPLGRLLDDLERTKARVRAKVEYPFRDIKREFGDVKVCHKVLKENTRQLFALFSMSNLWMLREYLLQRVR
jgi:IS5 family transposase